MNTEILKEIILDYIYDALIKVESKIILALKRYLNYGRK